MERELVLTSASLAHGDVIAAYTAGTLRFVGCVTEVRPDAALLWAVDSAGQRQLIDLASCTVYRLLPPYL